MLLSTIDRYILRELLKVFIISAGALTMVLFLDKFFFIAEMIVSRGIKLDELIRILLYISPSFLALTIPMGVLIASVAVFNQFSVFNEYIAMKACSWSYLDIMRPVLYFSLIAYLITSMYGIPSNDNGQGGS